MIAAQALSDLDYVLFTTPGSPPLTNVIPGFPALLLPIVWTFGDWTPAYQIFCALILAACPWAVWAWMRRRLDERTAILGALVFAASPLVVSQAGCVMAEAPYTLLAAILLLTIESPTVRTRELGGLLLALTQLRPAGLSLLPGVLGGLALKRRWTDAARILAPAMAGALLWILWSRSRGTVQEAGEWAATYRGQDPVRSLALVLENLQYYLRAGGGAFLPPSLGEGAAALALGSGLAALILFGAARLLRRNPVEPAALMLLTAGFMHLIWGWHYERYFIPLIPLMIFCAAAPLGRGAPILLTALLACQLAFHTHHWLSGTAWAKPELAATYSWLRAHMGDADVLASPLYARDGFHSARPGVPLPDAGTSAEFARLLRTRRVRFVLWQDEDFGLSQDKTAAPRLALIKARGHLADERRFRLVYTDKAGAAEVFALTPP